jgi:hypothetical protein
MARSYMEKRDTFAFCRRLMALPFLPSDFIKPVFRKIKAGTTDQTLLALISYMETQWVGAVYQLHAFKPFCSPTALCSSVRGTEHNSYLTFIFGMSESSNPHPAPHTASPNLSQGPHPRSAVILKLLSLIYE